MRSFQRFLWCKMCYCPTRPSRFFQCAGDTGFEFDENNGQRVDAFPSCYEKFGTSYFYRTELAAFNAQDSSMPEAAKINLMFDATGQWHAGGLLRHQYRYNTLFADGHVKNLNKTQYDEAWDTPIK